MSKKNVKFESSPAKNREKKGNKLPVTPCSIKLEHLNPKYFEESNGKFPDSAETELTPKKVNKLSITPCSIKLEHLNPKYFEQSNTKFPDSTESEMAPKKANSSLNDSKSAELKSKTTKSNAPLEPCTPKTSIEFSQELKKVINERNILTSKTRKRVFEALDEIKTKSEEESRTFKRERALLEIINSEIKYVHQLETVIHFFKKPIEDRKLLKPEDFQIIFGHIDTIYRVNKELLDELDKGFENVAKAFSKIGPFLKLYSVYAYDFKNILNILQNARALHPQFAKFIENQETRPEVQNKLSALLITPIQRVPRYKLLLEQLHKLTKPTEPDYDNLTDCLEKVNAAAEHINKIIEDHENVQRLLELQRYLRSGEPNVIKPGRKLLKEGILVKMSTKQGPSEKLYTVLMNDIIMFLKMKKDELAVNSLKCQSIFPLNKCKVVEVIDKGCLRITCQDEELILYQEHYNETKKWIDQIRQAIDDHLSDRKTLRKDSSSRRPVKRKDMYEYHEVGLSPGMPMKKRKAEPDSDYVPPYKLVRRPPIGSNLLTSSLNTENLPFSEAESVKENVKTQNEILSKNETEKSNSFTSPADYPKDLFIFGRPQVDQGFKFTKFLGGVGVTIKRMFGFRN